MFHVIIATLLLGFAQPAATTRPSTAPVIDEPAQASTRPAEFASDPFGRPVENFRVAAVGAKQRYRMNETIPITVTLWNASDQAVQVSKGYGFSGAFDFVLINSDGVQLPYNASGDSRHRRFLSSITLTTMPADDRWVYVENLNDWFDLPPGAYTLVVTGRNNPDFASKRFEFVIEGPERVNDGPQPPRNPRED